MVVKWCIDLSFDAGRAGDEQVEVEDWQADYLGHPVYGSMRVSADFAEWMIA